MLGSIPSLAVRTVKALPKRLAVVPVQGVADIGRRCAGSAAAAAKKIQTTDAENDSVPEIRASPKSQTESQRNLPVTNEPFAKNLFLGKFDKKILIFPEILSKEEVQELNSMYDPVMKFFGEQLDSRSIDVNAKIPDEALQQLKDFGLFGQQIPQQYGGLGLNNTQYTRMTEATVLDGGVSVTLGAHQSIGLKGILLFGTDAQKAKYLPKLATGEHIAAFALTEASSGSDAASIRTTATLSPDGKHFLLNGSKLYISNGSMAHVMTVFARTKVTSPTGETVDKVTAFIVERAFGGITNGRSEDKLGVRGSDTCSVNFDNTPVPVENVIGKVGGGFKVAVTILNSGRFSMGAACSGATRYLLKFAVDHAVHRKQFGKALKEFGLIQDKFANIALNVYAMESMSYVSAAIMDSYTNPDASVEAAMVKVFSSEAGWVAMSEVLQIFGGSGYMKEAPFERALRDCRIALIFEGTNEILRMYIALMGMQHAGLELRGTLKRMKEPLKNMGFMLSTGLERLQTNRRNPSLKMKLYDEVHPSLSPCAEALETRVVKMRYMVEKYLGTYKDTLVNQQQALKRFADISIDLFAITSCLARASRSKSIGLRNNDHEVIIARTFTAVALKRIDKAFNELEQGDVENHDVLLREIADTIFSEGGYAAEHPLVQK